jgi:hypothetical protein
MLNQKKQEKARKKQGNPLTGKDQQGSARISFKCLREHILLEKIKGN